MYDEVIDKINKLFITWRKYFIYQLPNGNYPREKRYNFNDKLLRLHLAGKQTYGIFSGEHVTKFISFDVDTKEKSEIDTRHLVDVLEREFNISRSDIHVNFSGSKGYHVDIYFSSLVTNNIIKQFYEDVIKRAEFTSSEVELRPLHNVGMKLPLGVHKVTGKRCWYVDNQTFKPIENMEHILNIEPIDPLFLENEYSTLEVIKLQEDESTEVEALINSIETNTNKIEECLSYLDEVLENNCLKYPSTRNYMTFTLAMYFKDVEEFDIETTTNVINTIMLNTKRTTKLISMDIEYIPIETRRVVEWIYDKDYKFSNRKKDVFINRYDIETILSIKKWTLKKMYFIHLIHAKRYAKKDGSYYMSYKTMNKYGGTDNRTRAKQQVKALEDLNLLSVLQEKVISKELTEKYGHAYYSPNRYQLKMDIKKIFNKDMDSIRVKDESIKLEQILKEFEKTYDMNLKLMLSKDQYKKVRQIA